MAHLYPDSTDAQTQVISALMRAGRAAQALPLAERVLARAPDNGDAWYWKGAVLAALNRLADAITAFRVGLGRQPANPGYIWGSIGDAYFDLSLFPESIRAYREAVRLTKDSAHWRFWLAVALKDGGYLDEAIALDEKMAAERPDDPAPLRQLGFAQIGTGQSKEAARALERSLSIDPKQARVWHGLMLAYHAQGRIDDMRRVYEKLRGLDSALADLAYKTLIVPYEEPK